MSVKHRLLALCGAYLAGIWIIGILPLASVLIEYGRIVLCSETTLGWFLATLYSSFFIYPLAIGGLAMAALLLPLATAVSLTRAQNTTYIFAAFYFGTTAVIAALEFLSSPNAPFSIAPQAITANTEFFQGLAGACGGKPFTKYPDLLPSLIRAGTSYTAWFYYAGFAAQALMQNALFVVFVAFLYYPKREIVRRAPYLPDTIFFVLGYAVFLGSIWCLFRLTYRHDMAHLLNADNPFIGDYAIVALYAIVLAVFVAYFQFNLEQLAKTISQIGQFLVFVGGVAFVQFDKADLFFGTQATITNIFVLFLLFVFISTLTLAFLLRTSKR
jgi:hypothetical protein